MQNNFIGTLSHIYGKSIENNEYTFGIQTDEIDVNRNKNGDVVCKGFLPKYPLEIQLIIKGIWQDDGSFNATNIKPLSDTEKVSKELIKNVIKQIKEDDSTFKISNSIPNKIIDISGPDILSFVKKPGAFDVLCTLKVDEDKLKRLFDALNALNYSFQISDYLAKFGCSPYASIKLTEIYGPTSMKKLKENPYKTGYLIGLPFIICDFIALDNNFDSMDEKRISAMTYEAINNILTSSGSTFTSLGILKKQIAKIVSKSAYPKDDISSSSIAFAIEKNKHLKTENAANGVKIYLKRLFDSEVNVAKNISNLKKETYDDIDLFYIKEIEKKLCIHYNNEQLVCFNIFKSNGIKVITGGPGTGKSTVVNGIIKYYKHFFPHKTIALCAPTGRAAGRLKDITGEDVLTIHKLLNFTPYDDDYKILTKQVAADFIIVDEMSMVDIEIFDMLITALKSKSTILLLGDENQLQSVSPGNVLKDIIDCNLFDVYRLKEVFRQKNGNTIIENAYKILDKNPDFKKDKSFNQIDVTNNDALIEETKKIFEKYYDKDNPLNLKILTPTNIGPTGTNELNKILSQKAKEIRNNIIPDCIPKSYGRYSIGDEVIFKRNNYDKGYWNGDIGIVVDIYDSGIIVKCGENEIKIAGENLKDVSLSYLITIHKSQGSEFNNVVILLPKTYSNMLSQNLLFTALTRASQTVTIIDFPMSLYTAVNTVTIDKRKTDLKNKLILAYKKKNRD